MKGEIICVGSEILYGDILYTNTKYLSSRMTDLGVSVYYQSVVGDYEQDLLDAIELAVGRSVVIILTGGLGPTSDDITKETLSKYFNSELIMDAACKERLESFFIGRGYNMTENNYKQALIPSIGSALFNNNGTAPGIYIPYNNKHVAILPGPPGEMKPMFEEVLVPILKKHIDVIIRSKTLKLIGIGESDAASRIQPIIDAYENPIIAPYAKLSEVHFKITSKGDSAKVCEALIAQAEIKIRAVLGGYIYTDTSSDLPETIIGLLKERDFTISLAESCTGGLLSKMLVDVPSVSDVYNEGFIVYSYEAKVKYLDVSQVTLDEYGAVSEQVAIQMAIGCQKKADSDIAISITGIAGPGGGTDEKPVGTVHIGIAHKEERYHYQLNLPGNREKIRENSAKRALTYLYFILIGRPI
ncbi:MAG: competence/damage-inducible protein A [Vallitaleaceae bacterium]|jgi:nicotinamide-nucleotide amidase|nr:competence/damage-inducible protein A [Vallitaleaceae bacterium]